MNGNPNDISGSTQYGYPQQYNIPNAGAYYAAPNTNYGMAPVYGAVPKKGRGWIKLIRVFLWALSITAFCVGWGLVVRSSSMLNFLNGTSAAMRSWGYILMIGSGAVILGNGSWGITRWALRWHREKWRTGKVIGKLIGGGIWRSLVFSAIVVLAFFSIPDAAAGFFQPEEYKPTTAERIEDAYTAGEISVAEYVKESAYATFDPQRVSERYTGENSVACLDFLDIAIEHVNELDSGTIEYITRKVLMLDSGITTDQIATGNTGMALASKVPGVTFKINRLTLSSNGKFAVYWADSGVNSITEAQAMGIGEMFERDVAREEELFGIVFDFQAKREDIFDKFGSLLTLNIDWLPLKMLAEKEGIAFNKVKQAMPIYMISPGDLTSDSATGAFYSGESVIDWLTTVRAVFGAGTDVGETAIYTMSIPIFPAITILPKLIGNPHMETITAHEFGHHFQQVYRGRGPRLDDDGYKEAHANYFAARVVENQESVLKSVEWLRRHNKAYLENNSLTLGYDSSGKKSSGYRYFGYLVNYAMEVEGGDRYIWDALMDGKNAYEWLTEKAGVDNKRLWAGILERNLTGEYGYIKVLVPSVLPHDMMADDSNYHARCILSEDGCRIINTSVSSLSTEYFYIGGEECVNANVKVTSGKRELVVILMGYMSGSGKWEKLDGFDGIGEKKFDLASYSGAYDKFAICAANSGLEDVGIKEFRIQFFSTEIEEIVDEEAMAEMAMRSFFGEGFWGAGNCIQFTTDNVFNVIRRVYDLAQELGAEGIDEEIAELERQRSETEFTKVFICLIPIKEGVSRAEVDKRAAMVLGSKYKLSFTLGRGENQIIIGVVYSLASNVSKVYVVMGCKGGGRMLITMRFEHG